MNLQVANRPAIRRTALAIALSVGFAGAAFAQSTTGSIFGDAPAAQGETVLIQNNTGFSREVAVGADGRFAANQLPLGNYTVTLRQNGQTVDSRTNVSLRVGTSTQVSFGASSADAQNLSAITVSANALPTIDVTGVDSRTVITAQQLAQLPLARSAESIALLAPGVVEGSGYFGSNATGGSLVSFGGASVSENAYYINGMNVTDPLQGLGGITLPYGSIEQQEVLTGGYGAAFGRSDGGVINQVGKRGTNEWHFGAQILWTPDSLRADPKNWYFPEDGSLYRYRNDNKSTVTTASAYVGGPLIKDKLYMFASVEGEKTTGDNVASAASGTMTTETYHDPKWYAKVDWNITDNHILEVTGASTKHEYSGNVYEYDSEARSQGDYLNADTHTKASADMWIAKYTGYITNDLTISAQYGEQKTDLYSELTDFDPSLIYISAATNQNPAYAPTGGIRNTQTVNVTDNPAHKTKGSNYRFDVTYMIGDHTITAGIDNQRTQDLDDGTYVPTDAGYMWSYGKAGSATERLEAGQVDPTGLYPGGAEGYYVTEYRYRTGGSVKVEQRAQYIEDSWQINDRWLVKLGLRNDQFTNYNSDGEAYLTQTKPQWAPRLGFSWDVNGDSSFKVYGNAGRYYLALPTSVALRGASGSLFTRVYYTYTGIDPATGYPTGLTEMNTTKGPGAQISSNNEYGQSPDPRTVTAKSLTAQYQDEYILGFDKQLNEAWTYGAKATYRSLKNAIDDTCNYQLFFDAAEEQGLETANLRGCYFFNPGRAATFQLPDGNGGYGELTLTNDQLGYEHAKRDYYGLNLYLDHPFDGTWFGRIDYTFSRSYGNTEGQVKSDIGQDDIGATQDWDYPSLMDLANGRLSNDRTHQLKIQAGYQINPEWMVSGLLTVMSGSPTSCLGAYGPERGYPAYQGDYYHWCNGQPAPAGSAGDLAWQKRLSVGVSYRPEFADKKLAFSMNVFNVFDDQQQTIVLPDYNSGAYRLTQAMSQPRYVRFGVSYDY
ncbi:TonB-dependent receptor [Frateuria hangzhouensis]|uniref:TonB-dependent receptor n=1 Tax=Frateuria hangzhouensis TaxID=2995589 RepID=UPI002260C6D0|nr:TonB-dependent receptor [Frateuria sp. STR12]MCX7512564.1 TonB-dependent receptor [Frateuria sp. STR12]